MIKITYVQALACSIPTPQEQMTGEPSAIDALLSVKTVTDRKIKVRMAKLKTFLLAESKIIEELRGKLVEEYVNDKFDALKASAQTAIDAATSEDDRAAKQAIFDKIEKPAGVPPEKVQEFMKRYNDLLGEEVEIPFDPIPMSALGAADNLQPKHYFALEWFLLDDEDAVKKATPVPMPLVDAAPAGSA